MIRILFIDDDEDLCVSLKFSLKQHGFNAQYATTASSGLEKAQTLQPDLILLDLNLPDKSGLEVLKILSSSQPDSLVAMITGEQDSQATIEAMKNGAFDYIRKPFGIEELLVLIEKTKRFISVNKQAGNDIIQYKGSDESLEIVSGNDRMLEIVKQIGLLARSQVTILIEGESGTGKELVAKSIHKATCPGLPFVAMNCSSIVSTLMESELFGHEKGAFTGAIQRKTGKLEHAGGGTVFLDEIGDMPLDQQAKILRVLQEREFESIGGLTTIPFEARVIAATNRSLESLIENGGFREDLFYRLAVTRLKIPSLRDRKEDIPLLIHYLISRISRKLHRKVDRVEDKAIRRLMSYDWPGNVRELENVLTRAIALTRGTVLSAEELEITFSNRQDEIPDPNRIPSLEQMEKEHVLSTLLATRWNISRTAKILDIVPNTLRAKIDKYKLRKPH